MNIHTPVFPCQNSSHNVFAPTKRLILRELHRGLLMSKCDLTWPEDERADLVFGPLNQPALSMYHELCVPAPFFGLFNSFIQIEVIIMRFLHVFIRSELVAVKVVVVMTFKIGKEQSRVKSGLRS
jgi:hypothetical protein